MISPSLALNIKQRNKIENVAFASLPTARNLRAPKGEDADGTDGPPRFPSVSSGTVATINGRAACLAYDSKKHSWERLVMDMDFLESFVVVVEHGSVAEAARQLNLTAAAVTQRLHALERELKTPLVLRSGRTMRPTEAGWAILPQAQTLLSGVRSLRGIANGKNFTGELNLGAVSSAMTGVLPPILSELAGKYPHMRFFVRPGSSNELYSRVMSGDLDAAVIIEPEFVLQKTYEWVTWREEPLIVLAHRGIRNKDAHRILQTEPFIRYDRKQWGGRLADNYLKSHGLHTKDRYELDSLEAIAVLVDRQLGVSLVPDWARPWPENLRLTKICLPQNFDKRRVGLLWRRDSARISLVHALLAEARLQLCSGDACPAIKTKDLDLESDLIPSQSKGKIVGRIRPNSARVNSANKKSGSRFPSRKEPGIHSSLLAGRRK